VTTVERGKEEATILSLISYSTCMANILSKAHLITETKG